MSSSLYAQLDTSALWVNVDSISITATRLNKKWLNTPQVMTEVTIPPLAVTPLNSLQDYIKAVPGVFTLSAANMSQDLRVSIRGFGSRASFGVRGVKLIVDGMPETTPDGQGQLDALPLGLLSSVEVIRGPSALLYGNASGGALVMTTFSENSLNLLARPFLAARITYGAFNTQQYHLTFAQKIEGTSYLLHAFQSSSDGYRAHSAFTNRHIKARLDHRFSRYSKVNVMLDYFNSPQAQDPGALVSMEIDSSRRQARLRHLNYNASEQIKQTKASISYSLLASKTNKFNVYGFYNRRQLDSFLPFAVGGQVDLDRKHLGHGASYTVSKERRTPSVPKTTFKYGYDIAAQHDDRKRYRNYDSTTDIVPVGPRIIDLNQTESFTNVGIYIIGDIDFNGLTVNGGLRFDHNGIKVRDSLQIDGDQSSRRDLTTFNPSLGINLDLQNGQALFAQFSTGFETPSLIELSNNPDGSSGFNFDLAPQRSINFDIGYKLEVPEQIKAQANLFYAKTLDELIPYMLVDYPDRTFYRNIGQTNRVGIELELDYRIHKQISGRVAYSFSRLSYGQHSDGIEGNLIPGIPSHNATFNFKYMAPFGTAIESSTQWVSQIFANDENTVGADAYLVSNLYLSQSIPLGDSKIMPFLGINNLTNTQYFDNIRINALNDRYFEPAAGMHVYGGLQFRL